MGKLYDTDIVAWASEQAELLRGRHWDALDLEHIAEEIEEVGKSEKRELKSRMAVLIAHLLKWQYQPGMRSRSWRSTVEVQRQAVQQCLRQTPSLKHLLNDDEWPQWAWTTALTTAITDSGLDDLPRTPIWVMRDILDPTFYPD